MRWPPESRIHISAYCAGSSASRWTTHASTPSPDNQSSTRGDQCPSGSAPAGISQFASICSVPPGARWSGADRMRAPTSSSRCIPPSRYSWKPAPARTVSGVMTKGGLDTMRSKDSPDTGSNREPTRTSIGAPLSAALNWVSAPALAERSVATTRPQWVARYRAWMPQPHPRSRAEPTRSRIVCPSRLRDAPPMPSTWSSSRGRPVTSSPRSEATHHWCSRWAPGSSGSGREAQWGRRSKRAARRRGVPSSPAGPASPRRTRPRAPREGSAASRTSDASSAPSMKNRVRTAAGSRDPASSSRAGTRIPRIMASVAVALSAALMRSTVHSEAPRSARRESMRSMSSTGTGVEE